jgi:myo-inositol-1(or 4)-monophosphatase
MTNWLKLDKEATQWIKEAGERIRIALMKEVTINTKSNRNDLVTNVDKETEAFLIKKIKEVYPDHRVLGEEGYGDKLDELSGIVWIVDPIDGTTNFVHQERNFAISIGIYENGVGYLGYVYDVIHDELYHAQKGQGAYMNDEKLANLMPVRIENAILGLNATWVTHNLRIDPAKLSPLVTRVRGTRSYGSAALEIAYIAASRLDAYITMRLSPWDYAGAKVLIEEVGGIATTLTGKPLNLLTQQTVFVAVPGLHEEILSQYLRDHD